MLATYNKNNNNNKNNKKRLKTKTTAHKKSGASIGVVEKMVFHHSENKDGIGGTSLVIERGGRACRGVFGVTQCRPGRKNREQEGLQTGLSFLRRFL